jgi:radical SAM/Cys-rich protein
VRPNRPNKKRSKTNKEGKSGIAETFSGARRSFSDIVLRNCFCSCHKQIIINQSFPMHATLPLLETDFPAIGRARLETLQVNMGYLCNQSCLHCHVNAGPTRKEQMTLETCEDVLAYARASGVTTLDLTGGAPELNANFRYLVTEARRLGIHVMDRCNLTVLFEPGQEGLAQFLADNQVEVVASMPCYEQENVDSQRGKGVYNASVEGIRVLNELGYAKSGTGLDLSLVYNPQGPVLPPPQEALEMDYRRELGARFNIEFTRLYTIANLPIGRFGSVLISKKQFTPYMDLLKSSYQEKNLDNVMCRTMVSVDWEGHTYDCDFNQMLGLGLHHGGKVRPHLKDLMEEDLEGLPIVVRNHCFGCTAGQGSSCGGALAS